MADRIDVNKYRSDDLTLIDYLSNIIDILKSCSDDLIDFEEKNNRRHKRVRFNLCE